MAAIRNEALDAFFTVYGHLPGSGELHKRWSKLSACDRNAEARIALYESAANLLEEAFWQSGCQDSTLKLLQRLYREMEKLIAQNGDDDRYSFIVVIPVADRPQHLENCLNSLLELCRNYQYGGLTDSHYRKLRVLVADDSKHPENIERHRQILETFDQQGLASLYFGQAEQLRQLDRLSQKQRNDLFRVIGDNPPTAFYHKGASITRNITLLKLAQLLQRNDRCLCWFLDSDQEFQVNTFAGERDVQAISYFHHLDRIFSTTDTHILTGKVVGDPPVSPAVMADNFLRDVMSYLTEMSHLAPHQDCRFHGLDSHPEDEASYHDMASLFGFTPVTDSYHYHCRLARPHDHSGCLADFSNRLDRFFDGEHPTRQTYYEYQTPLSSVKPARTVYTGNYVFRPSALEYFIPFAVLKLRMAGPVLGRILKAEQGDAFVSANLPMLHRRTVERLGQSEFRPDIDRQSDIIDLSGEYERQFYGDVMLFSMERLTTHGYPTKPLPEKLVRQILLDVHASMLQKYSELHTQILVKIERLKSLFEDRRNWWQEEPVDRTANTNFRHFINNMQHNFGADSPAYRMIHSLDHREKRLADILETILQLPQDRKVWREALSCVKHKTSLHPHVR